MRTEIVRAEIQRLPIGHPENIAFDPSSRGSGGSSDFYVIAGNVRAFSTFEAVTSVALVDRPNSMP